MKLALRLIAFALVGVVLVFVGDGILQLRRDIRMFHNEVREDAELLSHVIGPAITDAWRTGGERRAMQLIADVNKENHPVRFRWVWLDAAPGDPGTPAVADLDTLLADRASVVGVEQAPGTGEPRAYSYFRITGSGERPGALEISESLVRLHASSRATVTRIAVVSLALVLASALCVSLASISIVGRPLHRIIEQTKRIGAGDFTATIDVRPRDELGELAEEINSMSAELQRGRDALKRETDARIKTLEQLRHADRLQTVGRLASGVAHELGTPLNVVSGRASLIASDERATPDMIDGARIIRSQCDRMTNIIRQLLDFARRSSPKRQIADLGVIAARTIKMLSPLALKRQVKLDQRGAEEPTAASIDPSQIEQVLTNLVVNGIDAMSSGGSLTVTTGRRNAQPPAAMGGGPGEYCFVEIRDQGTGIGADDLPHVFEPFFTTKDVGQGTGLGLSISYGIVQEHGGWIDVSSTVGEGSCFTVYLPAEARSCPEKC